jgi:hypothetical protein
MVTFTAGDTSETISIEVKGDTVAEVNETVVVLLSNASNAVIQDGLAVGTINDDDPRVLNFSINDVTGNENQVTLEFTVTLSAPPLGTVSVDFATFNGSAIGGNVRGADFVHKSGKLIFMGAQTTKTVSISLRNDALAEPTEQFTIRLLSPSTGTSIIDAIGIGTITDDDAALPLLATGGQSASAAPPPATSAPQALAASDDRSTDTPGATSNTSSTAEINAVELNGESLTPVAIATGDQKKNGAWAIRLD